MVTPRFPAAVCGQLVESCGNWRAVRTAFTSVTSVSASVSHWLAHAFSALVEKASWRPPKSLATTSTCEARALICGCTTAGHLPASNAVLKFLNWTMVGLAVAWATAGVGGLESQPEMAEPKAVNEL